MSASLVAFPKLGPLNVLVFDANSGDAELAANELRRAGATLRRFGVASNRSELRRQLLAFVPDVVFCDFGASGLRTVKEFDSVTPVIFVSGALSEERAIEAIQSGAVDYVLKSNLARLPSAVIHAVSEARERQRLQSVALAAQQLTRQHGKRIESLFAVRAQSTATEHDGLIAMLRHASRTISESNEYLAVLGYVEGGDFAVQAAAAADGEVSLPPGGPVALAVTRLLGHMKIAKRRKAIRADFRAARVLEVEGSQAALLTTFWAGAHQWALAFFAGIDTVMRVDRADEAYAEVIASCIASCVERTWQDTRLESARTRDRLTGLPNRAEFISKARAQALNHPAFAIMKIDVSDFGEVNVAHGYAAGDGLLVEIGNALERTAHGGEIVARIGGNVFGVYLPAPRSEEIARAQALEFGNVFKRPFVVDNGADTLSLDVTASVGVATNLDIKGNVETIMSHADIALSVTKQSGPGSLLFYDQGMASDAIAKLTLRSELSLALDTDQLELYLQPHLDLRTDAVLGAEALVRWNHPTRGFLSPAHFIPFAERSGMITRVDEWVMRASLQLARDLNSLQPRFRLYFNLSGRQAGSPDVVKAFAEAARLGWPLESIGVEITETDAMRDVAATQRVCTSLRELGVHVALDDFGTGYSSLAALKQFPINIVKIDRNFVSGLPTDEHDIAIIEMIIAISRRFGFQSLAEGVETAEQMAWLRAASCDLVQGYGVCKPVPIETLKTWLVRRRTI